MNELRQASGELSFFIRSVCKAICLLILMSGSGSGATSYTPNDAFSESTPESQNTPHSEPKTIELRNGKLTVRIDSVPLKQVMNQLNSVIGINVRWQGQEITNKVTVKFSNLPFGEAISRILRDQNYALFYTSDNKEEKPDTILIVSQPENVAKTVIVTSTAPAIQERVEIENVEESMSDIEKLQLMSVLDDDTQDWIESIGPLLSEGDREAATQELTLALNSNNNAEVRMMALEALCMLGAPLLDEMIETALNDPEPMVQEHAAQCRENYLYDDQGTADILLKMGQNEVPIPRQETE